MPFGFCSDVYPRIKSFIVTSDLENNEIRFVYEFISFSEFVVLYILTPHIPMKKYIQNIFSY